MAKTNHFNWPQIAEEFLGTYEEDYVTREHIPDIAIDFRLEYALNQEPALLYITNAVNAYFGWSPCVVCGKPSVMSQAKGENPTRFFCEKHIPKFELESG